MLHSRCVGIKDFVLFLLLARKKMQAPSSLARASVYSCKAEEIILSEIKGNIELDINADVSIRAESFAGELSLNQIGAVSTIYLPAGRRVATRCRGIKTRIICDNPDVLDPDSADVVELNGLRSELTIVSAS